MPRSTAELITERLSNPRPKRYRGVGLTQKIQFWATPEEHAALKQYAEENGVGEGEALRYAIKLLTEDGE
ncbi:MULTISPECIES: hypothetical protein [unclassified Micromonospora]|uniref:hypothetical protein n=1 Tax=unclassified Micromonospora TaxID=2617518 RepID=UPI00118431B3|nr:MULTISPECIES: hypothetical protein [unclassified Micromonospora]